MEAIKKSNGKYTQSVIDRSMKLYKKGMTAELIEKITGMKRRSINYHAEKLGVERPCSNTKFTPRQAKDIKHLYTNCSLSSNQVAELLGFPARTVRRFLEREGLIRNRVKALRLRFKRRSNFRNQ